MDSTGDQVAGLILAGPAAFFLEIDHEIFFKVQEGQLTVSGERMSTNTS